ncbi:hypothetical protein Aab01nite_64730 [Paractinoplanes abujensis]|uniref:Uncharacterized protein n=1 Tax=Paractinoplanes abujensis TaxID=882441 RepID=A0A7W7CTD7_9ACTN|nr:hypothetical protein [Actinoplanes abujensis]MBB4692616.1 hypothetical protein [Actinoplanes abujensis]GID22883.1 hypothetical protein Aab01nite_64730 [Actinoplanes abujensis]
MSFHGVRLGGDAADVAANLRGVGVELVEDDEGGWTLGDGTIAVAVEEGEVYGVAVTAPERIGGELLPVAGGATGEPVMSHVVEPGRGIGVVALGETRAAVRARLHDALTWTTGPDAAEDTFFDDGLVVRYTAGDRVERIHIVRADHVGYAGVTVLPGEFDAVRERLVAAGHEVAERELAVELKGAGVQLWLANTQTTHRLPVSEVVIG